MTDPAREHSLSRTVSWTGQGLHTGAITTVSVAPADAGHGIVFQSQGQDPVPVHWRHSCALPGCSGLRGPDGVILRTVEHLLASLMAAGIDNAQITVEGGEIPILDGSAQPFMETLRTAGLVAQDRPRRYLRVLKPMEVRHQDRFIRLTPADGFSVDLALTMEGFGRLAWSGEITTDSFTHDIAPARSFTDSRRAVAGKLLGRLSRRPVLRGAGPDNLLTVGRGKVTNPGGLRFEDEFARHRVLDVIGDLALAGKPILGHVTAFRTAHKYNQALLRHWLQDADAWREDTR